MTDLRQQVNWIIRQIQCIRENGCLCFGYPTDLSYEAKGKKLTAKFVDGSTREATIPIPGKLSELENDLGILDPGSVKYEAEATATHAVGTLTVGTSTYPVKETVTVLGYDATSRKLTFVDEAGQTREITLNIPTKTSQLTNDGSGAGNAYLTRAEVVVEPALADGHKIATVTVDGQAKEVKETITTLELDKPNKKLVFKSNAGTKDILLSDLASSGAGQTVTHTHQLTNDGEGTGSKFLLEDQVRVKKFDHPTKMNVRELAQVSVGLSNALIHETVTQLREVESNDELRTKTLMYKDETGQEFKIVVSAMDASHVKYEDSLGGISNKHLIGQLKHGNRTDSVHETNTSLTYSERENKLYYVDENARTTNISLKVPKKTSELVNDGDGNGKKFLTTTDVKAQWVGSSDQSGLISRRGIVVVGDEYDPYFFDTEGGRFRPIFVANQKNGAACVAASSDYESQFVLNNIKTSSKFIISLDSRNLDRPGLSRGKSVVTVRVKNVLSEIVDCLSIYPSTSLARSGMYIEANLYFSKNAILNTQNEWWSQYHSGFADAKQITPDTAAAMLRSTDVLILKSNGMVHRVNAFTMMLVMAQAMTAVKTS